MAQSVLPTTPVNHWRSLWLPALFCALALAVEGTYIFRNLDQDLRLEYTPTGKAIAVLSSVTHEVRQKPNGTLVWQAPLQDQSVFERDAIATMTGSEAVVTFPDHSQLVIEADSLVVIEETPAAALPGQPAGQATRIVARLVKGSVKRKSNGAPGSVLLKMSSAPDAKPVQLDDEQGDAVFRIVHHGNGLEIIVEGGTIRVNRAHSIPAGKNAGVSTEGKITLPPPRLKKPKIEIKTIEPTSSLLDWLAEALIPAARAEPSSKPGKQVEIGFEWDPVPGAGSYVIQVSKDPSFAQVLAEQTLNETRFPYRITPPTEPLRFYFRVAAVSAKQEKGEFSAPQSVEINPEPVAQVEAPQPAPPPEPAPAPIAPPPPPPKPKKAPVAKAPAPPPALAPRPETRPSPAPPHIERSFVDGRPGSLHAEIAYGAQIHHRELKNDVAPMTASGSGFVPSRVRAQLEKIGEDASTWSAGGSILLETATPEQGTSAALGTPVLQAWGARGWRWGALLAQAGPYLTTSNRITGQGSGYASESRLVAGAIAALGPHPHFSTSFHWSASVGLGLLGARGADLSIALTQPLRGFRPARASETHGLFAGAELRYRALAGLETAYAAALELGYRL